MAKTRFQQTQSNNEQIVFHFFSHTCEIEPVLDLVFCCSLQFLVLVVLLENHGNILREQVQSVVYQLRELVEH